MVAIIRNIETQFIVITPGGGSAKLIQKYLDVIPFAPLTRHAPVGDLLTAPPAASGETNNKIKVYYISIHAQPYPELAIHELSVIYTFVWL